MVSANVMVLCEILLYHGGTKLPCYANAQSQDSRDPAIHGALKILFFSCAFPSNRVKRRRWVWKVEFFLISCSPFAPRLHYHTDEFSTLHYATLHYTTYTTYTTLNYTSYTTLHYTTLQSNFKQLWQLQCCLTEFFWFELECIREALPYVIKSASIFHSHVFNHLPSFGMKGLS